MRQADELDIGERFEPLEFVVTPEFNESYLHAVEDLHPRYMKGTEDGPPIVHPALLINFSNVTRSPSFHLPPGMAAVHTHEEVTYHGIPRVGGKFQVTWTVTGRYEKRDRPYQVVEATVTNEADLPVLRRTTTNTYMGGQHLGA